MASQAARSIKEIIGGNVLVARNAQGLTQSQLALRLGVESMAVSRWECGRVRPSDSNMQALASLFDHDVSWFFMDRDEQKQAA